MSDRKEPTTTEETPPEEKLSLSNAEAAPSESVSDGSETEGEESKTDASAPAPAEGSNTPGAPVPDKREDEPGETGLDPAEIKKRYVDMAINAGVAPLEVRYAQINSCYRRLPVAYRTFTYVNSVVEGVVSPEKYAFAAEEGETGIRLAKWNIESALAAVKRFEAAGRHVDFVTAHCPARLALEEDLYGFIKAILDENDFHTPAKLCLEFPRSLLYQDLEKVRHSILGMKLLKVRTMMTGCGENDCPVTALIRVPVDHVLVAPWITALCDDRSKGPTVLSFLSFLRSMQIEVICDGALNDEQIRILSRSDCYGYVPSPAYAGPVEHGRLRMTFDEALIQKEEDV